MENKTEPKKESLYSIVAQTKDIVTILMENDGVVTPEVEHALAVLETKTPAKLDAYAAVMERMEMEATYWKEKAESWARVGRACAAVRERLRDNIKYAMEQLGEREMHGKDVRFKLVNGKPKLVLREDSLESKYFIERTVREPNKQAIEADLKAGIEVEGAEFLETVQLRQYANSQGDSK